MYEAINEKIEVIAIFGRGYNDVRPYKFKWKDREFVIKKIGYVHKVREGKKIIHIFSCSDDSNFFELRFDSQDLRWVLGSTWNDETT